MRYKLVKEYTVETSDGYAISATTNIRSALWIEESNKVFELIQLAAAWQQQNV